MPSSTLRVDILGTSFSFTVEGEAAYLQAIYERYRTVLENTARGTGVSDPLKLAILAGLQITDDLEKLRSHSRSDIAALESMQTEQRVFDLIEKIDKIIPQEERNPETSIESLEA
jgi:cell division protein ZapA (FtsZ GTPase activity inhibitor)